MPCHAMHALQDYFWKVFHMHGKLVCKLYALLCWQNFNLVECGCYREVVRKEVLKLLKAGVIYPISGSEWVSPVQVVLKKGRMTVIHNEKNELIPQWTIIGWRMCITC
jgi:hypothetical protein